MQSNESPKVRILVVEDDEFFREAVTDVLKKKGYEIVPVPNGLVARDVLALQDFDIVVTDIQMPGLSGVELLKWAMANRPVPFLVMTGFSMLLETHSAFDLGAKEFLTKPFKNVELVTAVERMLQKLKAPVEETSDKQNDEDFCKVSIEEFVSRSQMEFDVYIRLSEAKYLKIAHKGDPIPADRVAHYKSKGLRYLYISKADFGKLVDFNLSVAQKLKDNSNVPVEKKMNFLRYTGEVILEKAFVQGVDKESFQEAQTFLNLAIGTITQSDEQFSLLNQLNAHSDYIYAHSIGVTLYSVMIARRMGFESSQLFFRLSTAAIFHDIGKKEIDRAILEKSRNELSSAERKLVESHVARTKEILMNVRGVPEEVVQMAYEHHEDPTGQGYPLNKTRKDMHALSKILQCANVFVEAALKSPHHPEQSGADAIASIERTYGERLDKNTLTALKSIFGLVKI
jgi:putative nucleotidyltransferase with HDIG domain